MSTQMIDVKPETFKAAPSWTGGDDKDFWGPPRLRVSLTPVVQNQLIRIQIEATWEEEKPNWTRAGLLGSIDVYSVASMGPQWKFKSFKETYDWSLENGNGMLIPGTDKGLQLMYQNDVGLVKRLLAEGDSWSLGVGEDHPRMELEFNRIFFQVTDDPT